MWAASWPANTLVQTATVGGAVQSPSGAADLGLGASFSNSPTITYTPLTGAKFIQSLMTPLPPAAVFFTIQSGTPADAILFATVSSINGLRNQETTLEGIIPGDEDFHRVRHLLRKIQLSGAVRLYVKEDAKKESASLLSFRTHKEVAVITRSVFNLMKTMASQVEVPNDDLDAHRAFPGLAEGDVLHAGRFGRTRKSTLDHHSCKVALGQWITDYAR